MDYVNFFKDTFESRFWSNNFITILNKTVEDLTNECGVLKSDINRLCFEF